MQKAYAPYALSFFRPRTRRAFRILRPAFVAIRERKPCRRLRTRFDGWNVRFDIASLLIAAIRIRMAIVPKSGL